MNDKTATAKRIARAGTVNAARRRAATGTGAAAGKAHSFIATPVEGVFLDEAGEITMGLAPGSRVVEPGDLQPRDGFSLKVGGVPLKPLGANDPDLAAAMGISPDIANAIKLAAQAAGVVSGVVGAVGFFMDAIKFMGLTGPEPNPFEEYYRRIEQKLSEVLRATLAGQTAAHMVELAKQVATAATAAQVAARHARTPGSVDQGQLALAMFNSLQAANTMRQRAFWMRTFDPAAVPVQPGSPAPFEFGPPVEQNGLVWDWQLALPAYLKILVARMAVVRATDNGRPQDFRDEFLGYANHLREIEGTIRSGFARALPIPDPGFAYWKHVARDTCGVAEMHSGLRDIALFNPANMWMDEIDHAMARTTPFPDTYADYVGWHSQATSLRYWRLYDTIGMFGLWQFIPDLETFANRMPSPFRKFLDGKPDFTLDLVTTRSRLAERFQEWQGPPG